MDRAEVLHAARYDIELNWKNTTNDFKLVLRFENSTFPPKFYIYVPPCLPLNMSTAGKNITLQEASRLYESLPWLPWGAICVSKRDLLILTSIRARRRQFSKIFRYFQILVSPCQTLVGFKIFTPPMDRAEVLHTARYDIELSCKNTTSEFKLVLS